MSDQIEKEETPKEEKMLKEEIYDRFPFTYKQVDRFTKILIIITIAFLIFAVVASHLN